MTLVWHGQWNTGSRYEREWDNVVNSDRGESGQARSNRTRNNHFGRQKALLFPNPCSLSGLIGIELTAMTPKISIEILGVKSLSCKYGNEYIFFRKLNNLADDDLSTPGSQVAVKTETVTG